MWSNVPYRQDRSASYSGTQRLGQLPGPRKTALGQNHGCPTPQNVGSWSNVSQGYAVCPSVETTHIKLMNVVRRYWRASCTERVHARLGGRESKQYHDRYLVGFLSYAVLCTSRRANSPKS